MDYNNLSLREWQICYARGDFNKSDYKTMCDAGWIDWFCKEEYLKSRLDKMAKIVMKLEMSDKVDLDKMGIYFKNNCPVYSPLYDDFRLFYLGKPNAEYIVEMLSECVKERYGNNYAIFHCSDWRKPVYTCRTSAEVVKWLNDCSSCK